MWKKIWNVTKASALVITGITTTFLVGNTIWDGVANAVRKNIDDKDTWTLSDLKSDD